MFLALRPMESASLNSSDLQEHLAMLVTSTLAINCLLRNFLNKAIGIINIANIFLNFITNTLIGYLDSMLDLNLSSAKDLRSLSYMVTKCIC